MQIEEKNDEWYRVTNPKEIKDLIEGLGFSEKEIKDLLEGHSTIITRGKKNWRKKCK